MPSEDPVPPEQIVPFQPKIPKRISRKKFIRTISLREGIGLGARRVDIPVSLHDVQLKQVVLATKVQDLQEKLLDEAKATDKKFTPGEIGTIISTLKSSRELMMNAYGAPETTAQPTSGSAALGAAIGMGISAGISMMQSDPILTHAMIAVTKSARESKVTEIKAEEVKP